MTPAAKHIAKTWGWAVLLAFVITFIVQLPLCSVTALSDFFEHSKKETAYQILSALFVLPGYIVFLWRLKTTKQRMINCVLYTISLIGLLPAVWIFGFYTSRLLFDHCI
jgi:hypothetical protein